MLTIRYESNFKKDFKRIKKRGYNINQLKKLSVFSLSKSLYPKNTKTILFREIIPTAVNVTSLPIGC